MISQYTLNNIYTTIGKYIFDYTIPKYIWTTDMMTTICYEQIGGPIW